MEQINKPSVEIILSSLSFAIPLKYLFCKLFTLKYIRNSHFQLEYDEFV